MKKIEIFPEIFFSSSLEFKWNESVSLRIQNVDSPKLYKAINACSFRMKMALGALLAELVSRRLSDVCDIEDANKRIEAAWAATIDPRYVSNYDFEFTAGRDESFLGTIEASMAMLYLTYMGYEDGNMYLPRPLAAQASLGRHVIVDKNLYDGWISDLLKNCSEKFPRTYEYDDEGDEEVNYDDEMPIPRTFFCEFDDDEKFIGAELDKFLKGLNYNDNRYLASPDDMLAAGFKGDPYRYHL